MLVNVGSFCLGWTGAAIVDWFSRRKSHRPYPVGLYIVDIAIFVIGLALLSRGGG